MHLPRNVTKHKVDAARNDVSGMAGLRGVSGYVVSKDVDFLQKSESSFSQQFILVLCVCINTK